MVQKRTLAERLSWLCTKGSESLLKLLVGEGLENRKTSILACLHFRCRAELVYSHQSDIEKPVELDSQGWLSYVKQASLLVYTIPKFRYCTTFGGLIVNILWTPWDNSSNSVKPIYPSPAGLRVLRKSNSFLSSPESNKLPTAFNSQGWLSHVKQASCLSEYWNSSTINLSPQNFPA